MTQAKTHANPRLRYQVAPLADDFVVDNSIMRAVLTCSTLAAVQYALHLNAKGQAPALRQGQVGHAALAEWLDTESPNLALKVYRAGYAADVAPAVAALAKGEPRAEKERARLGFERTRAILKAWLEARPLATWPLKVAAGDTELPISAPLPFALKDGRRVVFVALLDAIAKRRTGGLWSIDHKFRKGITDWWKAKQQASAQFTGQMYLAREWGIEVAGVYVNAIEIPEAKTSDRKCSEHGQAYKDCDTKHARHELFSTTRSAGEMAAWLATMRKVVPRWATLRDRVQTLDDIHARAVPMEGRFNEGCTFCDLKAWCDAGRPVGGRGDWFQSHRWDPLAERRATQGSQVT